MYLFTFIYFYLLLFNFCLFIYLIIYLFNETAGHLRIVILYSPLLH